MQVEPYLFFEGRCEEALEYYRSALGAEISAVMRYRESPDAQDKIMHSTFRIGDSTLMASDGHCQGRPAFQGISLTIAVSTEAEADRVFTALADGGQVQMPLTKTFYSPRFGMVADRFGVSWMVIVMP
jgi:PhnB protein